MNNYIMRRKERLREQRQSRDATLAASAGIPVGVKKDANEKHDPSSGQFTSGGGGRSHASDPPRGSRNRPGFSGYNAGKVGSYKIIEGIGPHGGSWMAKGRGEAKVFKTRREAEEHAEASSEEE